MINISKVFHKSENVVRSRANKNPFPPEKRHEKSDHSDKCLLIDLNFCKSFSGYLEELFPKHELQ